MTSHRDRVDTAIVGGTVLPMDGGREHWTGDVLIAGGRIVAVGPDIARGVEAADSVDADGCLVLPGFVQGHVHTVQSLLRHQADDLELLDWLRLRVWPYEASLDGDGVEAAAELGIAELLCGGTTTALDFGTTRHHERVFAAAERLGIRHLSGKTHMDAGEGLPAGMLEDTEESLAEAESLAARWHGAAGGRIRYAVCPRFALSCSRRLFVEAARLARRHGWLLHTHASENRSEVEAVRELTGMDNVAYLDSVGFTGPDAVLAHAVHLEAAEVELLARTDTRVCHCPGANLKLASGIADVPRLLAAGVGVALGADGPPCNNRLSIFAEMSLAATLHTLRHGPTAMDAWTVLGLATREGAAALGLDDVGVLEAGKRADVVVLSTAAWAMRPGGDPASRVVYGATAADVRDVWVDGRRVVRNGELRTVDAAELGERVDAAWAATRARMEERRGAG